MVLKIWDNQSRAAQLSTDFGIQSEDTELRWGKHPRGPRIYNRSETITRTALAEEWLVHAQVWKRRRGPIRSFE